MKLDMEGMDLCQFRDSLGKPGEGFHALRIPGVNLALLDVVGTLALGYGVSRLITTQPTVPWSTFIASTAGVYAVGITAHWLLCVNTQGNQYLGIAPSSE